MQADSLPSEPTGVPSLTNDIAFLKSSFSKIPEMVPVTHVLPRRDLPGNTASGTGCPVRLCLLTEVELIYSIVLVSGVLERLCIVTSRIKTFCVATLEVCSFWSKLFSLEPFHIPTVGPQAGSFIFTVGFSSEFKTN